VLLSVYSHITICISILYFAEDIRAKTAGRSDLTCFMLVINILLFSFPKPLMLLLLHPVSFFS